VLSVPPIGLGTWQTFDVGRSPAARAPLAAVLREFVELGGTLVDSSPMYGRAEEVVGELATSLGIRDRLSIATKVWTEGRAAGIAQMEESIRKLGGRVDLMQVHNLVDADAHLETLQAWKAEGRVRSIGITHYTSSGYRGLRKYIERGGIDVVQLNYSVAEREAERELLPLCRERNLAVLANRPLGSGALLRDPGNVERRAPAREPARRARRTAERRAARRVARALLSATQNSSRNVTRFIVPCVRTCSSARRDSYSPIVQHDSASSSSSATSLSVQMSRYSVSASSSSQRSGSPCVRQTYGREA
jgi:aryl-alcohol dehydrogenase-like predicted oxidoreductase